MSKQPRGALLVALLVLVPLGILAGIARHHDALAVVTWVPIAQSGAHSGGAPVSFGESDVLAPKQARAGTSAFVAVTFVGLPFGAMLAAAVALAFRHGRRARAEAALSPGAPLADGPAVVFGVVEGDPSAKPPVVVRIRQRGTEMCSKGSWSHAWRETDRKVEVEPFTLVRADGSRVQVEADERVVIDEALVRFERHAENLRDRVAEIVPGAEIHVTGELSGVGAGAHAGAYRASGTPPVLRPPRTGPMVIADEPGGDTDRRRARFQAIAAAGLAAAIACAWLVASPYANLVVGGVRVMARPTEVGTWRTWAKPKNRPGYWVTHYAVRAEGALPIGLLVALDDECNGLIYDCAKAGTCPQVPFVVAARNPELHQIGYGPTLSAGQIAVLILLGLGVGLAYPLTALATRPWYLRRKVNDSGPGRLSAGE